VKNIAAALLVGLWFPFAVVTAILLLIDAAFGAALSKLR